MESWIPPLLTLAVVAPLGAFLALLLGGHALPRGGRSAYWIATGAIACSFLLSAGAAAIWHATAPSRPVGDVAAEALETEADDHANVSPPRTLAGPLLFFGEFGRLRIELIYLVDGLTIAFFVIVSGVATCVTVYAGSYMAEEEKAEIEDPHASSFDGQPVRRAGRYARFFQFMSLFCFSMLGLVLAGDLLGVFVFWELVGAASYFLIGFYVERDSASFAANKAFLVNRIGDFGMLVGIAMLFGAFGTLALADRTAGPKGLPQWKPGLPRLVADRLGDPMTLGPTGVAAPSRQASEDDPLSPFTNWRTYLTVAGLALFCGCIGKSAQVPLHVWLPDAMEGPTPVSALVHSATMVAAGVYLLGRVYPLLLPETLVVVAVVGIVTALAGAAMATVATDLKKALAFSTMSQLGLMTLAMGVGGWFAALFHLSTHAFFKGQLFLGAGAVHHAAGTYDLDRLGGLARKMPITAATTLIAGLALAGFGLPLIVAPGLGLSGFHSKDSILEQTFVFAQASPWAWTLFVGAVLVGGLSAFYVTRIWLSVFWRRGEDGREQSSNGFAHAHDPDSRMLAPMIVLAFLAVVAGWNGWQSAIGSALAAALAGYVYFAASPERTAVRSLASLAAILLGVWSLVCFVRIVAFPEVSLQATLLAALPDALPGVIASNHGADSQDKSAFFARAVAGGAAFAATALGIWLAWRQYRSPRREAFRLPFARPLEIALLRRLYVDDFYRGAIVGPYFAMTRAAAALDRWVFDRAVDGTADLGRTTARLWTYWIDGRLVDGGFDGFALATYRLGSRLRGLQTGSLRQYVLFFVAAAVGLFILVFFVLDPDVALEALRKAAKSP